MTLGQRIQELRKQQNLSQEALGEKLGVSRQAVSRWEMDGAVPEVDKLVAMGRLFGVSLNDLLRVDEPGRPEPESAEGPALDSGGRQAGKNAAWLPGLALLAAVVGMAALVLAFGKQIGALQDQLVRLESRVAQLEQGAAGLDPAAPLVADADFEVQVEQVYQETVYTLTVTAAQRPEEMTVTLQAVSGLGKVYQEEMKCKSTSLYTAKLTIDEWPPQETTFSAVFQDGTGSYTQALYRLTPQIGGLTKVECLWKDGA